MTRHVLLAITRPARPDLVQVLMVLVAAVVLPAAVLVDVTRWLAKLVFGRTAQAPAHATCSGCERETVLVGDWTCGSCGATLWRNAFAPCPMCAAVTRYVGCACGASIPNEWGTP